MSQTISRPRLLVAVVIVLTLLGGVLLWTDSPAEAARPLALDHFRCYRVQPNPDVPPTDLIITVLLQDQFDIAAGQMPEATVLNPELFCNPVVKRHKRRVFEITNPNGHLTFYNIETAAGPERIIRYRNQFAAGKALLGQPKWVGVPTQKDDLEAPENLDHFKCYDVLKARPARAVVDLSDQWQDEPQLAVGGPVMFCNPTRKIHPDTGDGAGVSNARGHLMCYRTNSNDTIFTAVTSNQFGQETLTVGPAGVLCVPTLKGKFKIVANG